MPTSNYHATSIQVIQPQQMLKSLAGVESGIVEHVTCLNASSASVSQSKSPPSRLVSLRRERSSPIYSPSGQTYSPAPKRARTFREMNIESYKNTEPLIPGSRCRANLDQLEFNDFIQSNDEIGGLDSLQRDHFVYIVQKYVLGGSIHDQILFSFKEHMRALEMVKDVHVEPAKVVYLPIVDMHADTVEAMSEVSSVLHKEYIAATGASHLIVAGDAKTYLRLKELKCQYGNELDWLLPFIGDWHVLLNYQKVLMKVYFEAGLKVLAMCSGHRAETVMSYTNNSVTLPLDVQGLCCHQNLLTTQYP